MHGHEIGAAVGIGKRKSWKSSRAAMLDRWSRTDRLNRPRPHQANSNGIPPASWSLVTVGHHIRSICAMICSVPLVWPIGSR